MGVSEKMWDAVAKVIRMDDKVERLAGVVKDQQVRIESLTERVVRLETALEIALASRGMASLNQIDKQKEILEDLKNGLFLHITAYTILPIVLGVLIAFASLNGLSLMAFF